MLRRCPQLESHTAIASPALSTSLNHHAAQAEFARRQAVWQRDAAKATQQSAYYMMWLALGIWVTTGLLALFTFLLWYAPQTPAQ
jgi:hypothetical protein